MTLENLKIIVSEAINELKAKDKYLLDHNVNERSISHKLACYIGKRIDGWHVDAEYNRNMDDQKRLISTDKYGVMPDIIIHRRGHNNDTTTENNNLLVIEIKKTPTEKQKRNDILKLKQFIKNPPYFYKFGAFIAFDGSDIEWFSRE
ncbi:MAG: hypothetical protein J0647_05305 [Campylobacteraceae bacterium]|nr:hypothetical protein [Campylobacteraceae bacterium]